MYGDDPGEFEANIYRCINKLDVGLLRLANNVHIQDIVDFTLISATSAKPPTENL